MQFQPGFIDGLWSGGSRGDGGRGFDWPHVLAAGDDARATPAPRTSPRSMLPRAPPTTYPIHGGEVLAVSEDTNGLVGLTVGIFDNFWRGYEHASTRTNCPVVARCVREFRHPNNTRCLTYLIKYDDRYWPITHSGLLDCLTQQVRASLPVQRGL